MKSALTSCLLVLLAGCATASTSMKNNQSAAEAAARGPFGARSTLYLQLPPFDLIKESDYRPAYQAGMAEQLKEIDAIKRDPAAPTFENTIVAMERSGQLLARVGATFGNLTSSNTNPEHDAIDAEMSPKLAAHRDAIFLDAALFARLKKLFEDRKGLGLDAESLRLLERYHTLFVRAGAELSPADQGKLRKLNEQLSSLGTQFQQTLLKATNAGAVVVDSAAELDGLSPEQIAAAGQAAKARKLEGKWVIPLQNTTGQPALATLKNRALRERIYQASIERGNGGPNDTTGLIVQLVKLRAERAALLGYQNHAAYVLEDETAGTTAAVNKMLAELAPAAESKARGEAADIQKLINEQAAATQTKPFELAPWDWSFYSEQVRKSRFDFDEAQVRPYFELERVLKDGVFYAAHELYGVSFKERKDLPVYQADVRVFEVFNEDGSTLALFLFDPFARDNKQGGAWMSEFVSQSRLLGQKPVVINNLNISKPPAGQPVLVTFDDVNGLFHEFGHALHGMFSDVKYPQFSGTSVPTDFVEYPSQFNEMWSRNPKVLTNIAKHYQTGEPMPKALLDKVLSAGSFNEGFATAEYLAASIVDQAWHQLKVEQVPEAKDVLAFEAQVLKKAGMDYAPVPPRYRSPYFSHVFPGGYSAGYYAYIWSDVLAKDTEQWMNDHGGLTRANGDVLRAKVLSKGFSVDTGAAFRDFYGKDPDVAPLLKHRGLTVDSTAAAN